MLENTTLGSSPLSLRKSEGSGKMWAFTLPDMETQKLSIDEMEEFHQVCKIADHIFLYAAAQVAELLEIQDHEVDDDESAQRIAKEHPALLSGFMYAISSVYSAREGRTKNHPTTDT